MRQDVGPSPPSWSHFWLNDTLCLTVSALSAFLSSGFFVAMAYMGKAQTQGTA